MYVLNIQASTGMGNFISYFDKTCDYFHMKVSSKASMGASLMGPFLYINICLNKPALWYYTVRFNDISQEASLYGPPQEYNTALWLNININKMADLLLCLNVTLWTLLP